MAQEVPTNKRLFNMWVARARAKFRVYPSPVASAWVHQHYKESGGRFVTTDVHDTDTHALHVTHEQMKKVLDKNREEHDPKDEEDRARKERHDENRKKHQR